MRETSHDVEPGTRIVVVPLGSVEQHGPHLPLDTDARIADALCRAALERIGGDTFLLAPLMAYSASDEHAVFPGTLSLGSSVTAEVLRALKRSAWWAAGMVVVNGHGGNADALGALRETDDWMTWSPTLPPGGDMHAGRTETSLALHLFPDDVRMSKAVPGAVVGDIRAAMAAMREGGVAAIAPNGVIGDPLGASTEEGARLFASLRDDLIEVLQECRRTWIDAAR